MNGLFPFIVFFAVIVGANIIKKTRKKKDGPVIDLADFEYDSKKQVLGKRGKAEMI